LLQAEAAKQTTSSTQLSFYFIFIWMYIQTWVSSGLMTRQVNMNVDDAGSVMEAMTKVLHAHSALK